MRTTRAVQRMTTTYDRRLTIIIYKDYRSVNRGRGIWQRLSIVRACADLCLFKPDKVWSTIDGKRLEEKNESLVSTIRARRRKAVVSLWSLTEPLAWKTRGKFVEPTRKHWRSTEVYGTRAKRETGKYSHSVRAPTDDRDDNNNYNKNKSGETLLFWYDAAVVSLVVTSRNAFNPLLFKFRNRLREGTRSAFRERAFPTRTVIQRQRCEITDTLWLPGPNGR